MSIRVSFLLLGAGRMPGMCAATVTAGQFASREDVFKKLLLRSCF